MCQVAESRGVDLSATCRENLLLQATNVGLNPYGAVTELGIFKDITLGDIEGSTAYYGPTPGPGPECVLLDRSSGLSIVMTNQIL